MGVRTDNRVIAMQMHELERRKKIEELAPIVRLFATFFYRHCPVKLFAG
jgi:hypothetical protein